MGRATFRNICHSTELPLTRAQGWGGYGTRPGTGHPWTGSNATSRHLRMSQPPSKHHQPGSPWDCRHRECSVVSTQHSYLERRFLELFVGSLLGEPGDALWWRRRCPLQLGASTIR